MPLDGNSIFLRVNADAVFVVTLQVHFFVTKCFLDCLSSFTEVEQLEDTELYLCGNCKTKQRSTKKFWIRRLPNVSLQFMYCPQPSTNELYNISSLVIQGSLVVVLALIVIHRQVFCWCCLKAGSQDKICRNQVTYLIRHSKVSS